MFDGSLAFFIDCCSLSSTEADLSLILSFDNRLMFSIWFELFFRWFKLFFGWSFRIVKALEELIKNTFLVQCIFICLCNSRILLWNYSLFLWSFPYDLNGWWHFPILFAFVLRVYFLGYHFGQDVESQGFAGVWALDYISHFDGHGQTYSELV